ncbi:MAG: cyclic peptide export ABC transporter [gamma proteobacterium symbiont of Taylorina sp.]|nr:cyclic peptide export ABC transporter [gamma proteobacterium symbiont of Taylorina sp.]
MRLIQFIEKETSKPYKQILLIVAIAGIANSLLLGIVNHATQAVADNENLTQYFWLYMVAFALFLYAQWFAFERAIITIEDAIYNVRIRLTRKIQQVELPFMEEQGSNSLYARFTQSDMLISQAIPQITGAAQMSVLLIFSFLYLAYISFPSFLISMAGILVSAALFLAKTKHIKALLQEVKQKETSYFKSISHLINGFKEVKINRKKGQAILQNIATESAEIEKIKLEVGKQESRLWGHGRILVYTLLPVLIFVIPSISEIQTDNIYKISSTILFITGPIAILINIMPVLNRVNLSIDELVSLEAEMDQVISKAFSRPNDDDEKEEECSNLIFSDFKEISMKNVSFTYPTDSSSDLKNRSDFTAGPFNETIYKGELLFIIGGNGSGKSTYLKLLTGLYYPENNNLFVDSIAIDKTSYPAYRDLFSAIFTDFHLFDKFYGIENIDSEKVNYWLKKMKMQDKVEYQNGGFTRTSLSTGQRKRLAFIATILEDKPILVMDEFAADQDPQFRQYFYEKLLPEIKAMGKTVVAVTHDDHYFHVADRLLKMEEGRMVNRI